MKINIIRSIIRGMFSKRTVYIEKNGKEEKVEKIVIVEKIIEKTKSMLSSPTLVWFASLYFFSLLSIIIFNLVRTGFDLASVATAPEYYTDLFLHYGLNAESTYQSKYLHGFSSWLYAPFVVVFMGLALFFIKEAGLAFNSPSFSISDINKKYAYFSKNVFGYDVVLFGNQKWNAFYIGQVWLPIIAACIVTIAYSRHTKRETWIVSRFFISLLISFWLATDLAKMTDPNYYYDWSLFFPTLFEFRYNNRFVAYNGDYNPMTLTLVFTFFQFIPMIMLGVGELAYSATKTYLQKKQIFKSKEERIVHIPTKELPWIKERKKTKAEEEWLDE